MQLTRLLRRRVGCDGDTDTRAGFERCCRCTSKQQGLPNQVGTGLVLNAIGSPKSSGREVARLAPDGVRGEVLHDPHVCWCCPGLLQKLISTAAPTAGFGFVLPSLHYLLFPNSSMSTLLRLHHGSSEMSFSPFQVAHAQGMCGTRPDKHLGSLLLSTANVPMSLGSLLLPRCQCGQHLVSFRCTEIKPVQAELQTLIPSSQAWMWVQELRLRSLAQVHPCSQPLMSQTPGKAPLAGGRVSWSHTGRGGESRGAKCLLSPLAEVGLRGAQHLCK